MASRPWLDGWRPGGGRCQHLRVFIDMRPGKRPEGHVRAKNASKVPFTPAVQLQHASGPLFKSPSENWELGMLSQKAKYALKALLMLAEQEEGVLLQTPEIAEAQRIPRKFLELILLDLKNRSYVHSQRGKNGGYVLARPASEITFGQVVRLMDGPLATLSPARTCSTAVRRGRGRARWAADPPTGGGGLNRALPSMVPPAYQEGAGGRSSEVERQLPKLNVVGSIPIARSKT